MIVCRAELKTPAGMNGVTVTKICNDEGETILRIQNNATPHSFDLVFSETEWFVLLDNERP